MSRIRKIKPLPFSNAEQAITRLEDAVARSMMGAAPGDGHALLNAVFDPSVVTVLVTAYKYTKSGDRTDWHECVDLPLHGTIGLVRTNLYLGTRILGMLAPTAEQYRPNPERFQPWLERIDKVFQVHRQFEKVREVIAWMNLNMTASAARHYCPWLAGLLPPEHAFHEKDGQRYRESHLPPHIVELARECGAIVTSALLLGEAPSMTGVVCHVSFRGTRRIAYSNTEDYTSQTFKVL